MASIHCPNCGAKIDVEERIRWNTAFCKHCKIDLVVHFASDHVYVKYDPRTPKQHVSIANAT
jgi:predicted amidophosphoribosyltransferase